MDQLYPNYKEPKFTEQLRFELYSWFGRHLKKKKSRIFASKEPLLLDIGVGNNFVEGWTHVDFYTFQFRFWKTYTNLPEIQTDLRFPLNCGDNIVDGVYSSHTLEHLYPDKAYQLLNEIFRILKPSGYLRLIVPDIQRTIEIYNGNLTDERYRFKVEALCNYTQNYGHHSAWDEELSRYALESVGFINVKKVEYGTEGKDKRLIKEKESRKFESIVMEAQKSKLADI